jgi:hypothetical protein
VKCSFLFQKLKADEVSKFALCNTKMLNEITADVGTFVISYILRTLDMKGCVCVHVTEKLVCVIRADQILTSGAKVKNMWSFTSTSLYVTLL